MQGIIIIMSAGNCCILCAGVLLKSGRWLKSAELDAAFFTDFNAGLKKQVLQKL